MPWYAWTLLGFLIGVWTIILFAFLIFAYQAIVVDQAFHYEDET